MGGKTQQRVAGNAKPTNSGRIRGLLLNQQLPTGNVITFSALSGKQNKTSPGPRTPIAPEHAVKVSQESKEPGANKQAKPEPSSPIQDKPVTPSKDNTKLVLRKVGNRELYTRVKITDDEAQLESAVEPSLAGVKKPSYLTGVAGSISDDKVIVQAQVPAEADATVEDDKSEKEEEIEPDPDDNLRFDDLLDRVDQTKSLVANSPRVSNLHELDETTSQHEIKLLATFKLLLRKFSDDLSIEDWDNIITSLNKWVSWIAKSNHPVRESYQADLCASVFTFIHQLIVYAEQLKRQTGDSEDNPMVQSLLDDWADFRSTNVFLESIDLYLKLIKVPKTNQDDNAILEPMIEALAHIIITVDPRILLTHHRLMDHLDTRVEFDSEFETPKKSIFCSLDEKRHNSFVAVCSLLRSNSRVILITAHAALHQAMGPICENAQSATLISDQDAVDDILIFPPSALMAVLTSRDSIMTALLSDYRVGDISITMEPNTDSYACTLAYLFTWDLVIQFIVGVDKEIGQCMIHSLKKLGLLQRFLDAIFMLLPPLDDKNSLHVRFNSARSDLATSEMAPSSIKEFLRAPLKTAIKRPTNEIELVALHLYFSVALHMPVTVRKWYNNNSNKRLCNLVNEYTVKHISQVICSIEMDSVQEKCQERAHKDESKNLIIKSRPTAREVYAIYTRDEFKMELTIKLPLNYPLGSVQIDGGKRVGVTDVKWRSWLLQLTTFLAHQNGPILDGIDLWRKNIDKRFEGVEKCTICFSILHSNYQLPKKKCQTCANIFHNVCLYKWFESSGNSTCPLCRNPW